VFLFLGFAGSLSACSLVAQTSPGRLGIFDGQTDVGSVVPAGSLHYDRAKDSYTITSAGANIWSKADGFHFVWKKISGDASLTAEIEFPAEEGEASPNRKAVLMFRQGLDPASAYADAAQHGAGLTALQYRLASGETTRDIELQISAAETVRLERRGDTVTMFVARRGESLHQVGASIKLHLDGPFYAGLGVCAHNPKAVEKAVFSHVELKALEPVASTSATPLTVYSTLQTIAADANEPRATVHYTARGRFEAPNWTRDGKSLLFDQDGKIMQVAVTGGVPQALDIGAATRCNGSHGLSPDGRWLAITCSMPGMPESRVYVVPASGGTPRLVTAHPASYFHSWSADGKTIVFTRPDHGSGNIFAISAEGGEERALTTGDGISDDPDCSPDGKYIYFNSDRSGSEQIWRMRTDGSEPEQLTFDDRRNWTPHVSPDGRSIVYLSYAPGTTGHPVNRDIALRILSLEDRKVGTLVNLVGGSGTINVPSWAPDSEHFAFVSYQMLPAEENGSTE
jgi:Tol biopolymer transport system component